MEFAELAQAGPAKIPNWRGIFKEMLYRDLEMALTFEAATIPLYLNAAYSIQSQGGGNDLNVKQQILDIAKDEMLHLGLVGNILCGIGGSPHLYTKKHIIPQFPSELFKTKLPLNLDPTTKETIALFVKIEAPEVTSLEPELIPHILDNHNSIAKFYDDLQIALLHTDGVLKFMGETLFLKESKKKQLHPIGSGRFAQLFPVTGPSEAIRAMKIIVDQGEGSAVQLPGQPSHWANFKKIHDNYASYNLVVNNVVKNIDSKNYTDQAIFKFYPVMVASDAAYSFLFLTLETLWKTTDADKRTALIEKNLLPSMGRVIGNLAKFLVKQQIPRTNQYAGPPFRRYEFDGNQLADLKRWMKRAVDAYPAGYPDIGNLTYAKTQVDSFVDLA